MCERLCVGLHVRIECEKKKNKRKLLYKRYEPGNSIFYHKFYNEVLRIEEYEIRNCWKSVSCGVCVRKNVFIICKKICEKYQEKSQ